MTALRPPNVLMLWVAQFLGAAWKDYRFYAFILSILIYALFGSPTPERFGSVEAVVGALLIFAVGAGGVRDAFVSVSMLAARFTKFSETGYGDLWRAPAGLLFVYGMTVSLAMAVLSGMQPLAILRDVIPFLFLLLPLFVGCLAERAPRVLLYIFGALGVIFALRSLGHLIQLPLANFFTHDALYYLANSPAVLGAAIVFMALGLSEFRVHAWRSWAVVFLCTVLSGITLIAMAGVLQRASLGLFFIAFIYALAQTVKRSPLRGMIMLAGIAVFAAVLWPHIAMMFDLMAEKTQEVGANMRLQELEAIWKSVSAHPLHIVFGLGWGAQFQSPAVGMLSVNFTHSLVSAILLKCGIVGVLCLVLYLLELARLLIWTFMRYASLRVVVLALGFPFLIDVFLYAAYKSYDFGILLVLITLLPCLGRTMQSKEVSNQR